MSTEFKLAACRYRSRFVQQYPNEKEVQTKKKMALSGGLVVLALLLSAPAFASDLRDYSAQQLKAKMDRGDRLFLLCPLADIIFNEKYIPGSVNIPLSKLSKSYAKIPKDRKIIVVDHNGKQSKLGGKFLLNNGFTEVHCLKGGLTALEKE
jgi:rhodanese-related sulfurtransferase